MAFDIITVRPTISDGAHAAGDVVFNLTSFTLPAKNCKLVNVFAEVWGGGGEDDTKIGLLFFQKNDTASLGTLNATADISAVNFSNNNFIGASFLQLSDGTDVDLDLLDNVALYYGGAFGMAAAAARTANFDPVVLKAEFDRECFIAGVIHDGTPDFDGTSNLKLHLHVEYWYMKI